MNRYLNSLISILSLFALCSCIGTVADSSKKLTDAAITPVVKLSFMGVTKGMGISHNKVQLNFKPAIGGSGHFSYLVYQDGNLSVPVSSVSDSDLVLDKNGEYSVIVKDGLSIGTKYTFLMRAYDASNNTQDTNNAQVVVSTLDYLTPLFDGVQVVENFAGKEGESSLLVKWNKAEPATKPSGVFQTNTDTISGYNLYLGTTEENLAFYSSINDANATSFKITGLTQGTVYFLRVRAKNSMATPIEDQNVKFLTKKTLIHLPITFAGVKTVTIPNTVAGFSQINLTWLAGTGNYDRYKIFASKNIVSNFNPASATDLITTITDLATVSASISVSDANTNWYVAVVACSDNVCTEAQGQAVVKFVKTTPSVATFNGIKTISQPGGGDGLTSLDLNWDLPDGNSGVYDEIRVFKSDSNGNFNSLLDRVDNVSYSVSNPLTPGYTLKSGVMLRVNGLETGKQACFVAQAFSTSPFDASNPNGRTAITKVVKCATPQYNYPGFGGVKLTCTNVTAKTFKVSWVAPNPVGTFDDYEIYLKEGTSGFSVADAIAVNAGYTRKVLLADQLNYTFTGLYLNTTYQIMVKTHFHNSTDNKDYRDNNSIIATCSTNAPTIEQNPWFDIFAVGPKFNGLNGTVIPEKLKPISGAVDVGKTEWKHQFPVESTGADIGVSESDSGIIRLTWEDFTLSDGLGLLRDYNSVPNTGYKVYRLAHSNLFGVHGPGINDNWGTPINSDYAQGAATNYNVYNRQGSGFSSKALTNFVDYTLVHPYKADINKANQASVYWYKIEPWYNGKKLQLSSVAADAVIRVVLPPKNMSFVHRWMVNKERCENLGRTPLRAKNYSCNYNGMGATLDSDDGQYYADIKGDMLVDRFEMGCNFSRGNTDYKCTNTGSMVNFEGNITDSSTGRKVNDCVSWSTTSPDTLITAKSGAVFYNRYRNECYVNTTSCGVPGCSGTSWKRLSEIDGNYAFPYNADGSTSVPNALERYLFFPDGSVTTSKYINAGTTKIPPTYNSVVSDIIPVTTNLAAHSVFSQGMGYGKRMYTSDAKMPVISKTIDAISAYYLCQSNEIVVNNTNYLKRTSRRAEFVAFAAESSLLSPNDVKALETGLSQRTTDDAASIPGKNYVTLPLIQHNDRDCNSDQPGYHATAFYQVSSGKMFNDSGFTNGIYDPPMQLALATKVKNTSTGYNSGTNYNGNSPGGVYPMPGKALDFNDPRWATGGTSWKYAYLTTGSSGPLSSEACTSRYGVQDAVGNASEWNSDLFYCDPTWGCGAGFTNYAQTMPFTPVIDPGNKINYKNPDGKYMFMIDPDSAVSTHTGDPSFGGKLTKDESGGDFPTNSLFTSNIYCVDNWGSHVAAEDGAGNFLYCSSGSPRDTLKFFNTLVGLPMSCGGTTCQQSGVYDDNVLVTTRTFPPLTETSITAFNGGRYIAWSQIKGNGYDTNLSTKPSIKAMESGGDSSYGNLASRYAVSFGTRDSIGYATPGKAPSSRCMVLLPENY